MLEDEMPELRILRIACAALLLAPGLAGCAGAFGEGLEDTPAYRGSDPFAADDSDEGSLDGSGDDDDDDQSSDDDEQPGGASDGSIVALDPSPDSTSHHYRRPITITFDGTATDAMVRVVGPSEESQEHELPLLQVWNSAGTSLEVLPAGFLLPDSLYRVSVEQNDSVMEYSFTTSSVGRPLDSDVVLEGLTYGIVLNEGVVVSPMGLASFVATIPASLSSLWQFHDMETSSGLSIDTGLAVVQDDGSSLQDVCTPTAALLPAYTGVSLEQAFFSNAPNSFSFWLGDRALQLEEAVVEGDFFPDGSSIEEVSVRGWLVGESLAQLVPADPEGTSSIENSCRWLEEYLEASCAPCPSGAEGCLWLHVRSLHGELRTTPLNPVQSAQSTACDEAPPADSVLSCSMGGERRLPSAWLLLLPAGFLLRRRC